MLIQHVTMKTILSLLFTIGFLPSFFQDIAIQKLLYARTINGELKDHLEVWVLKDYIFRFNPKDTSESSLMDLKNHTTTINAFGRSHSSSTKDKATSIKSALVEIGKDTVLYATKPSTFTNQWGQDVSTTYDSIWFDKNVLISKNTNGSFNGFLDNGLGYLPLKFVRIIQNYQTDEISRVEFVLLSSNNIHLKKEWLSRYFYIE
jgi:hypothetical protein